ncbi:MAG: glycoside hydrolase family 16 protein [Prevotella sp.]|nr:glycoside hydrolase family 16 protein [Prevotella sp.]
MRYHQRKVWIAICIVLVMMGGAVAVWALSVPNSMRSEQVLPSYSLVWQDDFNESQLDTTRWSYVKRYPWKPFTTMSKHKSLYDLRNGRLRLYCRINKGLDKTDTALYITGGITTRNKYAFSFGKIEVRARIMGTQGTWPAIWTLTEDWDNNTFGSKGYAEIDLMESINRDATAHQTVHNYYIDFLKKQQHNKYHVEHPINFRKYNVYAAEILPDRIILSINGKTTLVYPKIETAAKEGQYPYGNLQNLFIEMQYGGTWVKTIAPKELPAYMDIDWVKVYRYNGAK